VVRKMVHKENGEG